MASLDAVPLDLDEGVLLGYALIARLAAERDIPVLGLKGPTLDRLGLRPPRQSIDVDVLVEPARFDDLLGALAEVGWSPPPAGGPGGHVIPPHSVPLSHPLWPVEIDVHHYFPGFLADAGSVFHTLWRHRTTVKVAGHPVLVPSRAGASAVALLHLLRGGERRAAELEVLVTHLDATLSPEERRDLGELVSSTAAAGPLAPALSRLAVSPSASAPVDPRATAAWQLTHDSGGARTVGWLVTMREAPLRRLPALVWRGLWLTEAELRTRYPAARPGRRGLLEMWLDRWWTGLRALPKAVLLLRDHRHHPVASHSGRTDGGERTSAGRPPSPGPLP